MLDKTKTFLKSSLRDLSWWKKRLLQLAAVLIVVGAGAQALELFGAEKSAVGGESESAWSWAALRSGLGCLFGFLIGALLRVFLKLGLLLGAAVAACLYGLSALGWIDLPWDSFGEISAGVADVVQRETSNLQRFLAGYLPSSALTGMGLFSGVTQKPEIDIDLNPLD